MDTYFSTVRLEKQSEQLLETTKRAMEIAIKEEEEKNECFCKKRSGLLINNIKWKRDFESCSHFSQRKSLYNMKAILKSV